MFGVAICISAQAAMADKNKSSKNKSPKKQASSVSDGMRAASRPRAHLPPQDQDHTWMDKETIEKLNKNCETEPYPAMEAGQLDPDRPHGVYVSFTNELDQECGCWYAVPIYKISNGTVRVHLADASICSELDKDEDYYSDIEGMRTV